MKVVRQARLELSGGSTPDQLRPLPTCCARRRTGRGACCRFFRGGLCRCGLVAGIGGSTSRTLGGRGPEPPSPPTQPPSRRARILVHPAPHRSGGLSAPLQPTPLHLLRPLEGAPRPRGIMSLLCPCAERDFASFRADGAQQLKPLGGFS